MRITSCRFEGSAFAPEQEPRTKGPAVIFLGRSNVGKSSLINRLLGVRSLARTSATPGKTQCVNFYRINESFHFVDLPGYGYAKVPESVRRAWKPLIEGFLRRRRDRIVLAILVVDARHAPREHDLWMSDWLEAEGVPYVVAATKADKLTRSERAKVERRVREALRLAPEREAITTSARTGLGVRRVWKHVDGAIGKTSRNHSGAVERRSGTRRQGLG